MPPDHAIIWEACPDCGGVYRSDAELASAMGHAIAPNPAPCARCGDAGSVPRDSLTAQEAARADRFREQDAETRNRVDF